MAWNVLRSCTREEVISKEKLTEFGDAFVEIIQDFPVIPDDVAPKKEYRDPSQPSEVDWKPMGCNDQNLNGLSQKKASKARKEKYGEKRKIRVLEKGVPHRFVRSHPL